MSKNTAAGRTNLWSSHRLVYLVVAVSGVSALLLELSWSRQVGLALGNTAQAVALVLAAYFAGLAGGQVIGARLAARGHPLSGYGVCELVTAAWSCAVPSLLAWGSPLGRAGGESLRFGADAAWCVVVLLPATLPLGATLPLVAEHLSVRGGGAGRRVSLAYGANTLGGVGGIALAIVLFAPLGVCGTAYFAAVLSAACGLAALAINTRERRSSTRPATRTDTSPAAPRFAMSNWWLVVSAASGFVTLGLEVLYTRMFALVLHNSTYTFGAVLAGVLAGLALGAALVPILTRRVSPGTVAVAAGSLGAIAVPASVIYFVRSTGLAYFSAGATFAGYLVGVLGLVAAVVLPPVTLLGLVLPAAFAAAGEGRGRAVGMLAATNTVAAACGALTASFLWVPLFGLWGSFALLSAAIAVLPAVALLRRARFGTALWLGATVAAACFATTASPRQDGPGEQGRGEQIVRRWESAYGWVDVIRAEKDGSFKVRENLHYRHGSTGANAAREYRQGRLPLLLHPRPADVAFLGLGTGLTASPVVGDTAVERAVVAELIPEVVEAARVLAPWNAGVVDNPKVTVAVGDGRNFLDRTDRMFDVVVSDLFVPWESRAGYLYTVEHYAAVRRRLGPGGFFCQWVALYQLGAAEFELIADSFAAVFPTTTVWWGQFDSRFPMVALVGSDAPLVIEPGTLGARWAAVGEPPGGPDPDLASPAAVADLYLGDWPRRTGRPLNTDEHPRLEFGAPITQRSGRALTGARLRTYFAGVFSKLPSGGAQFAGALAPAATPDRRRRVQSVGLFGSAGGE